MLRWTLVAMVTLFNISPAAAAYKVLKPPPAVVRIATQLAYADFPTRLDILAICRVESAYNPKAFNPEISKTRPHRKVLPSNGIMQVQGAPFNLFKNMSLGVAQLRRNYRVLHSREAAVKAYNIGVTGYLKGRAKLSAADYWSKFNKRRSELLTITLRTGGHMHQNQGPINMADAAAYEAESSAVKANFSTADFEHVLSMMSKPVQDRKPKPVVRTTAVIGRNDPCLCGSGKKFKKCCIS